MFKIYKHSLPNGKAYIGQTCKPITHRTGRDFSGYKDSAYFYNAVQKYGAENVTTEILYQCETVAEANRLETLCIARYHTLKPNGYNLKTGGSNGLHSDESKAKMRVAKSGENHPQFGKTGEQSHNFGKTMSDETKANISKAQQGKKLSDNHKANISVAMSGENNPQFGKRGENNPNFGKTMSDETKEKIRKANTGKTASAETRKKMSEARKAYLQRKREESENLQLLMQF